MIASAAGEAAAAGAATVAAAGAVQVIACWANVADGGAPTATMLPKAIIGTTRNCLRCLSRTVPPFIDRIVNY
ncbi:hypothetical protein BH09CHL1_BH09CHL1_21950 [soil metagenome]